VSVTSEVAELEGGPAAGTWVRVAGRPQVLQVTVPCPVEEGAADLRVESVHLYRRKSAGLPLRYGWDPASP
jgi:hypothetical protein